MVEMTRRERILASARGQSPDRLPFFHWWRHSQTGAVERECRNRGMGLNYERPPATSTMHGVDITEARAVVDGLTVIRRTYTTPVGSVYEDEWREPGTGQWHGNRSWKDVSPWLASRIIKGPEDYKVAKYMVEHTEYTADYFPIEQAADWLGDEGIVVAMLPHSPMQTLMIDWIGSEEGRCFYHMADYPELINELYQAISRSRQPLYKIAAESPAPVVFWGDNVDGQLVTPPIFEQYFMPEYELQQAYLRPLGKVLSVHMDGRLGVLKSQIARCAVDIVEAFHPFPMSDLQLDEAVQAWPDKTIWVGFPASIYELGPRATREYTEDLVRRIGDSRRVGIAMSTENIVSNDNLLAVTSILGSL